MRVYVYIYINTQHVFLLLREEVFSMYVYIYIYINTQHVFLLLREELFSVYVCVYIYTRFFTSSRRSFSVYVRRG